MRFPTGVQTYSLAEVRQGTGWPRGAQFALIGGEDDHAPARSALTLEFLRLGYAGASLDFKARIENMAEFAEAVKIMDGYNAFSAAAVTEAFSGLSECIGGVEIGRESSVVIYVQIPFWSGHTWAAQDKPYSVGEKYTDEQREAMATNIRAAGKALHADEIDDQTAFPGSPEETVNTIRLWWD
jgi:hypothetical protein